MRPAARAVIVPLRWEWFRLSRRLAFRVIMGMTAAAVILILAGAVLIGNAVSNAGADIPSPTSFPFLIFLALTLVGPFLAVFLTAIIFSGEYGWGTLRALLARGRPRWQVALAKLLLVSIVLAAVWIASWILSAITGLLAGDPYSSARLLSFSDEPAAGWGATALLFFGNLLAPIAYMSLTALLCIASRSATFGMAVAAAILIAESTAYPVAVLIAEAVYDFALSDYLRWTLRGATSGLAGRYADTNPWLFVPAVLAYTALFWALALTSLSKRDLTGGNG